jgi:hypothetical protein
MTRRFVSPFGAVLALSSSVSFCQPPIQLATVTGVVLAADKQTPVPDQAVRLEPATDPDGKVDERRLFMAVSDARGLFTLERVPGGEYRLLAVAAAGVAPTEQELVVRGRRVQDVQVVLSTHRLLRGRLLAPTGQPVTNRALTLQMRATEASASPATSGRPGERLGPRVPDALALTTDQSGEFRTVLPLPPETVRLGLHVPGVGWQALEKMDCAQPAVDLRDVRLQAGGKISGVITEQDSGKAIGGVRVTLYARTEPARLCVWGMEVESADDGRFAFDGLPPGDYNLLARCAGARLASKKDLTLAASGDEREVALEMVRLRKPGA